MACPPILNHQLKNNSLKDQSLCDYAGKVVLAVNTASECGFTGQYKALQSLYDKYKDKGLVVLGFPSNDFGGQEPGSDVEIKTFCERNYGVSFPLFAKSSVKGDAANPFFKALAEKSGTRPKWNFYKYLINRKGDQVVSFSSMTGPEGGSLIRTLEKFLAEEL